MKTQHVVIVAILFVAFVAAGVLTAAGNKFNIGQILGPGASQNGFVLGVTPGGQLTFLGIGTGLSISGSTLNASGSLPTFVDYVAVPGVPNGVTTAFTLTNTPSLGSLGVFKNGQLLQPGAGNDYTLAGAVITFAAAPLATENLQASYRF